MFGSPPFDEITLVEAPLAPGTPGLAFSGLIALASAYYTDVRGEEGRALPGFIRETPDLMDGALEFEAMHQAAHQWWGESVGSDPQRTPFLDEALASYSAVAAVERLHGAEARERAVEQQLRTPYRVFRMFGGRDEPVQSPTDRFPNYFGYGAIIQGKGGMWFVTLREQLGDERFFDGLRRYYAAQGGGIARPRDLVEALAHGDRAAREQVDRLYERWVRERHGDEDVATPEYAVQVPAGVADGMSEKGSVFERFGRFVVRKMAQFGKTAAKPF
jgi:hypothetical protein